MRHSRNETRLPSTVQLPTRRQPSFVTPGPSGDTAVGGTWFDDGAFPSDSEGKVVSPDTRIAALAARQHGAFTTAQALAVELTMHAITHRLQTGRWIKLHLGVYAIAGTPRTDEQRIIAAVLSLGPQAVAASLTAAWLLGLVERPGDLVYVVLPDGQHRQGRKGIGVREARLTRTDVRTVNGIRCTGPERTIVDVAGVVTKAVLEAIVDDAVQLGRTTIPKLRRYVSERRLGHRPGAKMLRELLDDRTKGVPQKDLEKLFIGKLRRTDLAEPKRQVPCGTFFIDFAYPDAKVAIELHGKGWHFNGRAFREDPRRQNQIVLAGWRKPLIFTWEDVDERWPVVEATIRRALAD